jgi:rare lipoprotein A
MRSSDRVGVRAGWIAASMLALGACASGGSAPPPLVDAPAAPSASAADLVSDTPVRLGNPYSLGGRSYTPTDQIDYDEVGYASWYGAELGGELTANGERFRPQAMSAAHRTLPLPSYVEVSRLDTGRTILVRINDRGPADPDRLIDLSTGAAEALGIAQSGMAQVRVRRVNPVEAEKIALRAGQAAPLRPDMPEGLLEILRERVARLAVPSGYRPPAPVLATAPAAAGATAAVTPPAASVPPGTGALMVQVAAFSSRARAEEVARRVGNGASVVSAGTVHRVRMGPFADEAAARAAVAQARAAGQPGAVILRGQ